MPDEALTRREQQVLAECAKGLTDAEIGRALGIAENTVGVHMRNLMKKLGVDKRLKAVLRVLPF